MKAVCILNHTLDMKQIKELNAKGIDKIEFLPGELANLWAQLPTTEDLDLGIVKSIVEFVKSTGAENCIIQGEMGHLFVVVDLLLSYGIKCYHAVTKRVSEEKDGVKISKFEHVCFREYKKLC